MRIRRRKSKFKDGDHLMQCDLTGRVDHRSKFVKLWNNLWAHVDYYEERNPQDFLKARPERQALRDVRPRTTADYTEVTADDL